MRKFILIPQNNSNKIQGNTVSEFIGFLKETNSDQELVINATALSTSETKVLNDSLVSNGTHLTSIKIKLAFNNDYSVLIHRNLALGLKTLAKLEVNEEIFSLNSQQVTKAIVKLLIGMNTSSDEELAKKIIFTKSLIEGSLEIFKLAEKLFKEMGDSLYLKNSALFRPIITQYHSFQNKRTLSAENISLENFITDIKLACLLQILPSPVDSKKLTALFNVISTEIKNAATSWKKIIAKTDGENKLSSEISTLAEQYIARLNDDFALEVSVTEAENTQKLAIHTPSEISQLETKIIKENDKSIANKPKVEITSPLARVALATENFPGKQAIHNIFFATQISDNSAALIKPVKEPLVAQTGQPFVKKKEGVKTLAKKIQARIDEAEASQASKNIPKPGR